MLDYALIVATLVAVFGTVGLVLRFFPSISAFVLRSEVTRTPSLDGLRGLLAVSVLLHHTVLTRQVAFEKSVRAPTDHLVNFLGNGAVAFFFIASAYLFGGRLIRTRGEVAPGPFLLGRVRRIVPMYVAAVLVVFAFCILSATRVQAPAQLARELAPWFLFDFQTRPDLNDLQGSAGFLGVVWTLRWEWLLYAILPILAIGQRLLKSNAVLIVGLAVITVFEHEFALFLAGVLAVYLVKYDSPVASWLWAALGSAGLLAAVCFLNSWTTVKGAVLLLPAFVMFVQGKTLPATWLKQRTMRFLGQISYSVYLLHVLLIHVVIRLTTSESSFAGASDMAVAATAYLAALVTIGCSTLTFVMIERPAITVRSRDKDQSLQPQAQVP